LELIAQRRASPVSARWTLAWKVSRRDIMRRGGFWLLSSSVSRIASAQTLRPALLLGVETFVTPVAHAPCADDAFENGSLLSAEGR
jgi:hypothetical protein